RLQERKACACSVCRHRVRSSHTGIDRNDRRRFELVVLSSRAPVHQGRPAYPGNGQLHHAGTGKRRQRMKAEIVIATSDHIVDIAKKVRPEDREELWAATLSTPIDAMTHGLNHSDKAYTGMIGGVP